MPFPIFIVYFLPTLHNKSVIWVSEYDWMRTDTTMPHCGWDSHCWAGDFSDLRAFGMRTLAAHMWIHNGGGKCAGCHRELQWMCRAWLWVPIPGLVLRLNRAFHILSFFTIMCGQQHKYIFPPYSYQLSFLMV